MLTDEQIAAIRERTKAATPGPWEPLPPLSWVYMPVSADQARDNHVHDTAFVAAARTDVPALCDEVERLRAERESYRVALVELMEAHDETALIDTHQHRERWVNAWNTAERLLMGWGRP